MCVQTTPHSSGLNLDRDDMLVFAQGVLRFIMMKTSHFSLASPLLVELIGQERGLYWKLQFKCEYNKPHQKDPRSW